MTMRGVDETGAGELFAVVDLVGANPGLRRSLSDASASAEQRVALAERLFGSRISADAMALLRDVVSQQWSSSRRMVRMLERDTVRALLRTTHQRGELPTLQEELHAFATTVAGERALADTLRNPRYSVEARRDLVGRLTRGRVSSTSAQLLERGTGYRDRALPQTLQEYLELAAEVAGQQVARVTVARPLDAQRRERLQRALENKVGSPVVLQITVDPAVLGGMDVRVGDHIIESTMAGRLEDARRQLQNT